MKDAPKIVPNSEVRMSCFLIRLPKQNWQKLWNDIVDPVVPLERNLYGHPLAGLLWEKQFTEVLLELGCFANESIDSIDVHPLHRFPTSGNKSSTTWIVRETDIRLRLHYTS